MRTIKMNINQKNLVITKEDSKGLIITLLKIDLNQITLKHVGAVKKQNIKPKTAKPLTKKERKLICYVLKKKIKIY